MTAAVYPERLATAAWLKTRALSAIFEVLSAQGHAVRAIGGAVRDSLMGREVGDVDLATDAVPETVIALAEAAGMTVVPTGLAHGTVSIIGSWGAVYQVTTLRRDIETFGRHARVVFTADWTEDARRRDFTINALSADRDGTVYDPLGGLADIEARRVRFIGDARARIREDYLRILRFFRFTAEIADGAPDEDGLSACIDEKEGLFRLSGERIRYELLRLLAAPRAVEIATVMAEAGIFAVLGLKVDLVLLERVTALAERLGRTADPLAGLAALSVTGPTDIQDLRQRLALSNKQAEKLAFMTGPDAAMARVRDGKAFLYRYGEESYRDAVLFAWARSGAAADDRCWQSRFDLPLRDRPPLFPPVKGRDVVKLGVPPGPEVGRILAAFEAWWIANDFPSDATAIDAALRAIVSAQIGTDK